MLGWLSFFFLLLPFQWALSPTDGIDLALMRVVALSLAFSWLILGLVNRNVTISLHPTTFLWGSFLFFSTLSLWVTEEPSWGIRKLLFLFSFAPLYLVLTDILRRSPDAPRQILSWLVMGSGLAATVSIFQFGAQFVLGLDPTLDFWRSTLLPWFLGGALSQTVDQYSSLLVNISGTTLLRGTALFPDPHVAAYFFGITFPSAVILAQRYRAKKKFFLFIAGIILLADLLTFSRGGYIGLLFGVIFWFFFSHRYTLLTKETFRTSILLITLGIFLVLSPAGTRFLSSFSLEDGSNQGRFAMWQAATEAIILHPWLGVGIGNFPLFVQPDTNYRTPIYAHNLFLDVMAESGIPNGIIFVFLIATATWSLVRLAHSDQLFLGPAIGIIIFSAHSLFETPLFSVHILPVLILFLAISTIPKPSSAL